jgi:DnaK suppressor protein
MTQTDISLPNSRLSSPPEIGDYLAKLEDKRRRQLDKLPDDRQDLVARAHRAWVERIVVVVSTARQRHATGLYGICADCDAAIDPERLESRPWAVMCTGCATRPG